MRKNLLFLFSLLTFTNYAQECVDRMVCSDDMVTVFLTEGSIYSWGVNQYGQLGAGNTLPQTAPTPMVNANLWLDVCHARMHTIALKPNGTIWAWGNNAAGQLGNGTTVNSSVPVQVGSASDWTTISAGNLHSVALKSDGTLWGWGNTAALELANTALQFYSSPIQISTDTNWAKIYAGYFRTFGIKTNGTLWGRGRNFNGTVGVGNGGGITDFTQIGTDANWAKVSCARSNHNLALKTDGTLWAWGDNENGRLGDGTIVNRMAPVQIGNSLWKDIAAGDIHSLGIKMDGTLWQWGSYGWINGVMLIPNSSIPVQVGSDNDWETVAAGYSSSYAVKEDTSLWAWGYNGGALGDGTTNSVTLPKLIIACPSLSNEDFNVSIFMVYPNPAKDVLRWSGSESIEKYEIVDVLGQMVIYGESNVNQLDVSHLSNGLYLAVFYSSEGKIHQSKFLKE